MPPLRAVAAAGADASGTAHWPSWLDAAALPSHRRGTLEADASGARDGSSNSTTTFVQVKIEQNTTTFENSSTSIPSLQNETTVGNYNFFEGPSTFPWELWNPSVLWLFCAALMFCTAFVLGVLALRRYDNSFSCRALQTMGFMFSLASIGYLAMALDMGHIEEVYMVEVFDGIVETPGRLKWRAAMPPIVWLRHVTWAATTCIQLHLLMEVASNGKDDKGLHSDKGRHSDKAHHALSPLHRPRSRRSKVVWEMRFYMMALNLLLHVSGLIGTVVPKNELSKWIYWIFACAMFSMICNQLTWVQGQIWRVATKNKRDQSYRFLVRIVLSVWALYPVVWAIGDGSRTINWEVKELVYVLMDLIGKFAFLLGFLGSVARDVLPPSCQTKVEWMCGAASCLPNLGQQKVKKKEREGRERGQEKKIHTRHLHDQARVRA